MNRDHRAFGRQCLAAGLLAAIAAAYAGAADPWVSYPGGDGPGKGKRIVLVSGDQEYRSEEALPQLAKILAERHGFQCKVLFAIDAKDGTINPDKNDIPGLEALDDADLMVIFTRFRDLPDEQMKHIADYVAAGKPVVGLRTATHAFSIGGGKKYARFSYNNKEWDGGFGRQILGETWINHHGDHGRQSTRGLLVEGKEGHPILKGIKDGAVWGPTDVYTVRQPLPDCTPLLLGQVLKGMDSKDEPLEGKKNDPMMPVAWVKTYKSESGKEGRAFATTMGSSQDLSSAGTRRLLVNATFWAAGLEGKITDDLDVDLVGEYKPTPFRGGGWVKGVRPADLK